MLDTTSSVDLSDEQSTAGEARELHLTSDPLPGGRWYCFQATARAEADVCQIIENKGFATFLPLVMVERRHARRKRVEAVAMFPTYGFVRFDVSDPGWRRITHRNPGEMGVYRIFGPSPERPLPVPQRSMDWMIARGYDRPIVEDPRPALIPVGATIRVTHGAFADHSGVCVLSSRQRVALLLEMFGGVREVTVKRSHVQQVTEPAA